MTDTLHVLNTLPADQVKPLVSSPAYQLPEIPSDAEVAADDLRRLYGLPYYVKDFLIVAYLRGEQAGYERGYLRSAEVTDRVIRNLQPSTLACDSCGSAVPYLQEHKCEVAR